MIDLAADFPAPTRDDWMDQVAGVLLKGESSVDPAALAEAFARRLVHRTEDGIEVQPLYTRDDVGPNGPGLPGFAPFVRGLHPAPAPWEVRQRVWCGDGPSTTVAELESGATGLLLEMGGGADVDDLDVALEGVLLDLVPVSLSAEDQPRAARSLLTVWERRGTPADDRRGTLGVDPLGRHARLGGATDLAGERRAAAAVAAEARRDAPRARALVADGTVWHEAGATPAQEIGWTTVVGAEYVRLLVESGLDLRSALRSVEFRWSATADQFGTVAKLRAARRVWTRVAELAGALPGDRGQYQHADSARSMLTLYDPWVNVLRSTVACFAAGVGGASAISIAPHDLLSTPGGSPLGRRVARNTQSILLVESNLARVADMAGGSWYVETLTEQLAQAAWEVVVDVESTGGVAAALGRGSIQGRIDDAVADRSAAVATRRRPLTGTTEFPDLAEVCGSPPDPPRTEASAACAPLSPRRVSESVERLRLRADRHAEIVGSRPAVYLATIGPEAVFTPRLTFARNMFGVAGIAAVSGPVSGYDRRLSPIACLCSSDAVYNDEGSASAAALRSAGADTVLIAGRGLDLEGVDRELGVGTDMLGLLGPVLDRLEAGS